jgi:hypothetical protein
VTHSLEPSHFPHEGHAAQAVWWWRLLAADGGDVTADREGPPPPRFTSQGDAESWVGECWRDLVDEGVASVVLLEGDREVYGPMSLAPPS